MQIISHRGLWNSGTKPNSKKAFAESFQNDFGTEFDVRDLDGEIVISHDAPLKNQDLLTLDQFIQLYNSFQKNLPLAINIKSDGLQNHIKNLIEKYRLTNYFLFDMSVPDAISYHKRGVPNLYTRQSEYEKNPSFYNIAHGVWIDEFYDDWVSEDILKSHLDNHKKIAIVSPELHKKSTYLARWEFYKKLPFSNLLTICTDLPKQAQQFFQN